jgi:hypothetical protein
MCSKELPYYYFGQGYIMHVITYIYMKVVLKTYTTPADC